MSNTTVSRATRGRLYLAGQIIGMVAGSVQVVVTMLEGRAPLWLTITNGVLLFVGGQLGALARLYLNPSDTPPAPDNAGEGEDGP